MNLYTLNKIININLKKEFCKDVSNKLFDTYFIFLSLSYVDYKIRLCKKLSICNTPILEISNKNKNHLNKVYFWLSEDGSCYIKDAISTVIVDIGSVDEIIFDKIK